MQSPSLSQLSTSGLTYMIEASGVPDPTERKYLSPGCLPHIKRRNQFKAERFVYNFFPTWATLLMFEHKQNEFESSRQEWELSLGKCQVFCVMIQKKHGAS